MECDKHPDLDGDMTISETESACEVVQNGGYQLEKIKYDTKTVNGTVFLINKTCFNEKLTGRLQNLHFYELKDNDVLQKVKEAKEELGWTYIDESEIYAKNLTTKVMIFGKNNY